MIAVLHKQVYVIGEVFTSEEIHMYVLFKAVKHNLLSHNDVSGTSFVYSCSAEQLAIGPDHMAQMQKHYNECT